MSSSINDEFGEIIFEDEKDPWQYYPKFIDDDGDTFRKLYDETKDLVKSYMVPVPFKEELYPSNRLSCKFMSKEELEEKEKENEFKSGNLFSYNDVPSVCWEDSPTMMEIKGKIHNKFEWDADFSLLHDYRNGEDNLGYHADKEAWKTLVFSLSLGATRKFRFREKGQKSGYYKEYDLEDGDLIVMTEQCQRRFLHGVPKQLRVKDHRLNVTFRQRE
jgi:alkylated DNA repair dioxygenase AlkB